MPAILTAGEVAKILGISRAMGYNLLNRSGFPTLQIGKRKLVPKDAFIQWIKEHKTKEK